jgi:PadR family transcriptional regulator, regulatory protein PadR
MNGKLNGLRLTLPTQLVLRALLVDPTREMYGLQICQEAGLPSGTIHPILARLERAGIVESDWEDGIDPHEQGRPRRRYYKITPDGAEQARDALARATQATAALNRLRPGLAGGNP